MSPLTGPESGIPASLLMLQSLIKRWRMKPLKGNGNRPGEKLHKSDPIFFRYLISLSRKKYQKRRPYMALFTELLHEPARLQTHPTATVVEKSNQRNATYANASYRVHEQVLYLAYVESSYAAYILILTLAEKEKLKD